MIVLINSQAHEFKNVDLLIKYLANLPPQEEPVTVDIDHLNQRELAQHDGENFTPAELDALISFINNDNNNLFFIAFDSNYEQAKPWNERFADIFLVNQRQKSKALTINVASPTTLPQGALRKAKVDMVRGEAKPDLFIQRQQQRQQQQQQQQQINLQVNKRTAKKPKNIKNEVTEEELKDSTGFEQLVDRHNITALFKHRVEEGVDLIKLWDDLVGEGAERLFVRKMPLGTVRVNRGNIPWKKKQLNHLKVTHVDYQTMWQIIKHRHEFCYGLVPNNLPQGFYFTKIMDEEHDVDKHILCYSSKPEHQHLETVNPLTVRARQKARAVGTYQQFILERLKTIDGYEEDEASILAGEHEGFIEHVPNSIHYKKRFAELTNPQSAATVRKEALYFFMAELMDVDQEALINEFDKQLKAADFDDNELQGLAYLMLAHGAKSVILFLQAMSGLKEKNLYNEFRAIFLTDPRNYPELGTAQSFKNLKKLVNLNASERAWWDSLIKQHAEAGHPIDFNDLFNAFDYFVAEVNKMGLKLTLSCPVQNIKHMKTALDRTLTLLKSAVDPQEQLVCLTGLDYGPFGAYLASQEYDFNVVSKEMDLTLLPKVPTDNYAFPEELNFSPSPGAKSMGDLVSKGDPIYNEPAIIQQAQEWQCKDWAIYKMHDHSGLFKKDNSYTLVTREYDQEHKPRLVHVNFKKRDDDVYIRRPGGYIRLPEDNLHEATELDYNPPSAKNLVLALKAKSLPEAWSIYYRYVAKQTSAYSIEVYQTIQQLINNTPQLTEEDKRHLMAIIAVSTTNANSPLMDPIAECTALIEKLIALDAKHRSDLDNIPNPLVFKARQDNAFLTYIINSSILENEVVPSLKEIMQVMELIEAMPKQGIDIIIGYAFNFLHNYRSTPDALVAVINNTKLRAIKEKDNPKIKALDFRSYQIMLESIGPFLLTRFRNSNVRNAVPIFVNDDEKAANFITLLSCLGEEIDLRGDTIERVKELARRINQLNGNLSALLLELLANINIAHSHELPSISDLNNLLDAVEEWQRSLPEVTEEQDAQLDKEEQRTTLFNLIAKHLPSVQIGQAKVNESLTSLINIVKDYVNSSKDLFDKLEESISGIPVIGGKLREILSDDIKQAQLAYPKLITVLNENPINIEEFFKQFNALQAIIFTALNKSFIFTELNKSFSVLDYLPLANYKVGEALIDLISVVMGEKEADITNLLKSCWQVNTLMPLLQVPFEKKFNQSLDDSIRKLQLSHPDFTDFVADLRSNLGKFDINKPFIDSVTEYSTRFNQLNSFINALVRLKNHNIADYWQVIKKLDKNLALIPLGLLAELLDNLSSQKTVSVATQLQVILTILRNNPPQDPKKLVVAVQQTKILIDSYALTERAYLRLLEVSFNHNLHKTNAFPLQEMVALKALINNKQGNVLFDNLVQLMNTLKDDVSSDTLVDIIKNITIKVDEFNPKFPQVVQLVANLLACCQNNNQQEFDQLNQCLENLTDNQDSLNILHQVLAHTKSVSLQQVLDLQVGLSKHSTLLPAINRLFSYRPYPNLNNLTAALKKSNQEVQEFIKNFDRDPKGARAGSAEQQAAIITQQFSTKRVQETVLSVQDLLKNSALSAQQQYSLVERLVYINAIGKDYPFKINNEVCKDLTQTPRETLHQYWVYLTTQLKTANLSDDQKNQLNLKLLAVLREMFFRATGKFPRTTQMLSVLVSLDNPQNLLMEIETGEGKSITTALLAVMQWSQGGTVDVCTANQGLVFQDYYDKGAVDFFSSLAIKSAVVHADSPEGTYQKGGINYSTIGDITIYRQRAKIEQEDVVDEHGQHLLLDEVDSAALDERTLFNYATGGDEKNPHAWIYPLINQFIDQPKFRRISRDEKIWIEQEDIRRVKIFIDEQATTQERKKQLFELTDSKWNKWLNAACVASMQKEGEDFIIYKKEGKLGGQENYVAVPLASKVPQYGASLSYGVQQFLQARLQKDDETKTKRNFPIDAEMTFVASESAKDSMDFYYQRGRIMGISATVGNQAELAEQSIKFDMKAMRVPPYEKNKRIDLGTVVKQSTAAQINSIKQVIDAAAAKTVPVLLVCKDINQARAMEGQLLTDYQAKGMTVQLVTGEETEETRQRLIDQAGQPNTLTISTSLLGRGTDINPQHEQGLLVIQAYPDSERTTRQITGRAARNGKVGRYVAIYDVDGLPYHYEARSLMKMTAAQKRETLRRLQHQINEDGAVQRHYLHEVSGFQQVILTEFDRWQALLDHLNQETDAKTRQALQQSLLTLRGDLIEDLNNLWRAKLDASDPERQFANPYVRRGTNGKLDTAILDETLASFRKKAKKEWAKVQKRLSAHILEDNLDESNQLRIQALQQITIDEQWKLSKITRRQQRVTEAKEAQDKAYFVAEALDEQAAVLKYSADAILPQEKQQLRAGSINTRFNTLKQHFDQVIDKLPLNASKKAAFKFEINAADNTHCCHNVADALTSYQNHFAYDLSAIYRMQPVLAQFMGLWNEIKSDYGDHVPEELNKKIEALQNNYLDNVANQLVNSLEENLVWAVKRGWDYRIERGAVKTAAQEILAATQRLKSANNHDKPECINALYQILYKHQTQLKNTWVFAIGHKDIRQVIQNSLAAIENVTNIAELKPKQVREQSAYEYHMQKFDALLNKVAKKMPKKGLELITEIEVICANSNDSLYVFYELERCIKRYQEKFKSNPAFLKPLGELMKGLQREIQTLRATQDDLLTKSGFITLKEKQLVEVLNRVEGAAIQGAELRVGHTGFKEYVELIVTGEIPDELADQFDRYEASTEQVHLLQQELESLRKNPTVLVGLFNKRIKTLQQEIAKQEKARTIAVKHFDSMDDLLAFEQEILSGSRVQPK